MAYRPGRGTGTRGTIRGNTNMGSETEHVHARTGSLSVKGDILPSNDQESQYSLGSPENHWDNIYTGDLHLKNERGDWTIVEEEDCLTIINNKKGKKYKFVLEEIPE